MKLQQTAFAVIVTVVLATLARAAISDAELQKNTRLGLRLLSMKEGAAPEWKTEEEKMALLRSHVRLIDVTEVYDADHPIAKKYQVARPNPFAYPDPAGHKGRINSIINQLSIPNMQNYLANLTSFTNRFYKSPTGAEASDWIVQTVKEIAARYPQVNATVAPFPHPWGQGSIIAKIPGMLDDGPITILGAHMDCVNWEDDDQIHNRAPGADDDGSATVNLIEAFRALVSSDFYPVTPVEFHWYSGEEVGLLGSQAVSKDYQAARKPIKAMVQFDMTAYHKPGTKEAIGFLPDNADLDLTNFAKSLVDTYCDIPWAESKPCGYGCSDHASWYMRGYPTAIATESTFDLIDTSIHTSRDTAEVDGFSWEHSLELAKLGVAYVYALGSYMERQTLSSEDIGNGFVVQSDLNVY